MNESWMPIIVVLLPLFGAMFGHWVTIRGWSEVKKLEVLNKYHGTIMEKRIAACDAIDIALRPFLLQGECEGKPIHNVVHEGFQDHSDPEAKHKNFTQVYIDLNYAHRFTEKWVSKELSESVRLLADYACKEVDKDRWVETMHANKMRNDAIDHAAKFYDGLNLRIMTLHRLLMAEYASIDDIPSFLKSQKSQASLPSDIVDSPKISNPSA